MKTSERKKFPTIVLTHTQAAMFALPSIILIFLFVISLVIEGNQQFSMLAQSFFHGHLYFMKSIGGIGNDPLIYKGHQYWGEGLFPSIALMPFVGFFSLFNIFFYQGYLKVFLLLGILILVFKLARKLKYDVNDSIILMFAFALCSVFLGVATVSSGWLFAQVLTTFLIFWSLWEYFNKQRWWLLGTICGCILLTRITAAPIVIFYALEVWRLYVKRNDKLIRLFVLALPLIVALLIQGLYNYLRFGSAFDGGYKYQLLYPISKESLQMGLFSLSHIPSNLYSLLLRTPLPVTRYPNSWVLKPPFIQNDSYGLSIFFTSPYLLYLFTQNWKKYNHRDKNLIVAIIVSLFMVLCYFGIGSEQFGYRYSLDFLPELFLLFMIIYKKSHKNLSNGMKALLLLPIITNFYVMLSFL